jgi:hypothetical protein
MGPWINKSRRKERHRCLHFCSEPFTSQPPWNPERIGLIDIIFSRTDGGNCHQGKEQQSLLRTDHTLGHNDSLILIRLIPLVIASSDLSQNKDWDSDQPSHTCDWDCLTMQIFFPLPKFFFSLSLKLHVYVTPKMAAEELKCFLLWLPLLQ